VLLGDFRDPWSAERERDRWVERYPNSLVIPGEIALPPMASSQNTIAEPLKELGDE
jgi:hypothetical protein